MRITYISGPMSNYPQNNYPEFMRVERRLIEQDYHVINPARLGKQLAEYRQSIPAPPPQWLDYMQISIYELTRCHEIFMLLGWAESRGAMIEFTLAKLLGIKVTFQKETV